MFFLTRTCPTTSECVPLFSAKYAWFREAFPEQAIDLWAEYAYLFEKGRWLVCDLHLNAKPWKWKELTDVLAQIGQD